MFNTDTHALRPQTFEAETTLHLIPTEALPSRVLEAVEAGHDGPKTIRMAVLDPHSRSEIADALPLMLAELASEPATPREAALFLAHQRAHHILENHHDPLPRWSYFHALYLAADYDNELACLAYALDERE